MLRSLFIFTTLLFFKFTWAQNVTGSWYGKADVMVQGITNNYLTELVLKQKGNEVEGVFAYYFKDSYQSFFIRGTYDVKSREVFIKNLPLLFYAAETRNGIECPMNFQGTLMVSQVSSTLKGIFFTQEKYKYTCPELRVSLMKDEMENNQDSVLKNTVAVKKFWQPQPEDFVVSNQTNNQQSKLKAERDTINKNSDDMLPTPAAPLSEEAEKKLVAQFEKRKNTYSKELEVESDSVRISFYDNGDIDGDIISIFLNKTPVIAKQELSSRSLNVYLSLDSLVEYNEVGMFADNLGKYPPNTALMVVTDGINRYEVYLSSSLTQNATVRLKRKKK